MKLGVREGSQMLDEDELMTGNREGSSAQALIEGMTSIPELSRSPNPFMEYRDID